MYIAKFHVCIMEPTPKRHGLEKLLPNDCELLFDHPKFEDPEKHLELDGTVTSVATEDLNSNSRSAMGVAGDAGQLLLYLHLHDPNSKE
ncbi:hypothetical protein L195_g025597 [Trifolium pratense]|uniref:Uncharacterized protein n=1 Tax=Trifolium pratense TaxID=57577 RepID=A0A2K3NDA9_TRIPR|nr:hypothetical protein L195_g021647 [Trifolium pratense]PNY01014.1 hypothetical protein L195_g024301 [Trifolium pratense]PNY02292.1 hypothetical protein L195_g025597 [Trifolium pratense]